MWQYLRWLLFIHRHISIHIAYFWVAETVHAVNGMARSLIHGVCSISVVWGIPNCLKFVGKLASELTHMKSKIFSF